MTGDISYQLQTIPISSNIIDHWRIQGGARDALRGSKFFFTFSCSFLQNNGKIIALLGVGAPPLGKILDPPLHPKSMFKCHTDEIIPMPPNTPSHGKIYANQDFPDVGGGGRQPLGLGQNPTIWQDFCQKKLHLYEGNWTEKGVRIPGALPLGSANAIFLYTLLFTPLSTYQSIPIG